MKCNLSAVGDALGIGGEHEVGNGGWQHRAHASRSIRLLFIHFRGSVKQVDNAAQVPRDSDRIFIVNSSREYFMQEPLG